MGHAVGLQRAPIILIIEKQLKQYYFTKIRKIRLFEWRHKSKKFCSGGPATVMVIRGDLCIKFEKI